MSSYTMDTTKVKPQREIRFNTNGRLLACTDARYDNLVDYVLQLGAPLSQLKGAQCFSFAEPIEGCILLLECAEIDWCSRCDKSINDCQCPF